jgi:pimeloyl-ACP methyl ester carboxylesterase
MIKPSRARSDAVAIESAVLEYERRDPIGAGRRDAVVMLHPWYGCFRFWDRTVEALPEYETFALDLYSLGARAGWEKFASPVGLSRAVEAFADALRLERFSVIGNSMGGITAGARFASRRPDLQVDPGRDGSSDHRRQARLAEGDRPMDRGRSGSRLHRADGFRPAGAAAERSP